METQDIKGHADERFARVADAFRANLRDGKDTGAALCIYERGRPVVDLWGGYRDRKRGMAWRDDTVVPLFSTTKGVAAITCAHAVSQGLLNWDDEIARHWPAFGRNGKAGITVRQLLDHNAGLVLFGRIVTRADLASPEAMARILEDMTPLWEPGTRWGYHLATFGALVGELIRRVDPAGRSIGAYFRDELAAPLGLSLSFGWQEDRAARAHMDRPALSQVRDAIVQGPFGLWRSVLSPLSLLHKTVREIPDIDMNDPDWLRLEFPSANGVGEIRAVARLYSSLANNPGELGISDRCMADLTAAPDVPPDGCRDQVTGVSSLWHLGFIRPNRDFDFSPSSRAFGMPGFGGSFGFCDPDHGIGYAYAPNRPGLLPFDDPREKALRAALYEAIER